MPRWLGRADDVAAKRLGSVILAFRSAADAKFVIDNSISIFGKMRPARHFEDMPRLRACDKCCSTEHASRICPSPAPKCGVCSGVHFTALHTCEDISCEFDKQDHPAGTFCEHTKLKCPHCGGPHMVRDPQCKIWQQRRNALRKPQHGAAKTGGRLRQTKSRAALTAKDGTPASGANATKPAAKSRSKAAAPSAESPDAPAPAASQDAAANAPTPSQTA